MKTKMTLALVLLLSACGKDKAFIINNSERVAELERRADLNDVVNNLQNINIENNSIAIDLLESDLESLESDLRALILAEEAARIQGDLDQASVLASQVSAQNIINESLQSQIDSLRNKHSKLSNRLAKLRNRVNNINESIDLLTTEVNQLSLDLANLEIALRTEISDLSDELHSRIDLEGVRVYKCNSPSSKERIFEINGKFYAVMNYVQTRTVKTVSNEMPISIHVPKLCREKNNHNSLKLPNNGGQCTPSNNWEVVPNTDITQQINSYSSVDTLVVTSVQMALEQLQIGSYSTTDGGPSCNFSITSLGSVNLIQVQ